MLLHRVHGLPKRSIDTDLRSSGGVCTATPAYVWVRSLYTGKPHPLPGAAPSHGYATPARPGCAGGSPRRGSGPAGLAHHPTAGPGRSPEPGEPRDPPGVVVVVGGGGEAGTPRRGLSEGRGGEGGAPAHPALPAAELRAGAARARRCGGAAPGSGGGEAAAPLPLPLRNFRANTAPSPAAGKGRVPAPGRAGGRVAGSPARSPPAPPSASRSFHGRPPLRPAPRTWPRETLAGEPGGRRGDATGRDGTGAGGGRPGRCGRAGAARVRRGAVAPQRPVRSGAERDPPRGRTGREGGRSPGGGGLWFGVFTPCCAGGVRRVSC